jgi:hypothetical protein
MFFKPKGMEGLFPVGILKPRRGEPICESIPSASLHKIKIVESYMGAMRLVCRSFVNKR